MSHLREDIERTNLDIPDGEIEIVSAADPVYANAIEVHEKKKEEVGKTMAEKEEEVKDGVLGIKGKTTTYPKTKDLKKMKLSEKLFEDYVIDDWKLVDKEVEKDIWTSIYNELNGDIKRLDARTRRFVKKPSERYSESDLATSGDVITVYADDNERLDFAREVAEEYGVEYKVTEHTSRYAPAKFSMKIYTSEPVTNESLDNIEAFGRKAKNKDLKESANGEVYGKVAKYFEYGAPGETLDTVCDIVDRAVSNIEEGYDLEEAVFDALDSGLIYHKDNWAIKHYYEDSELEEGTYESLFHDVYSIVSDLVDKDVEEDIDKTEETCEKRELDEDVKVNKYGFGSKLKSGISKLFQGQQDFEKALDDGEDFKGAIETAKKKSSERDEEKRLEQQKLSNKRDNRLPTFILKELISWRDDNGSHMGKGPERLTKHIEDIRKQGEKHPIIISASKKMRVSPSEYYDMWDKAADTALKFKKTPTAKIKISYK